MLDEELCEIREKRRAGYEWFENNGVRFYASGVRLWAIGGILFFLLSQSRCCGDQEAVYLRSLSAVDIFVRSHRVEVPFHKRSSASCKLSSVLELGQRVCEVEPKRVSIISELILIHILNCLIV